MTVTIADRVSDNSGPSTTQFHVCDLPANIQAGDLLLVAVEFMVNTMPAAPNGWSVLCSKYFSSGWLVVYYRIADGSEASSVVFSTDWVQSGTSSAYESFRITGHDPNNLPSFATFGGATSSPNPPALSVAADLAIAIAGWRRATGDVAVATGFPANCPDSHDSTGCNANNGMGAAIACASQSSLGSGFDPGSFALDKAAAWSAVSVGVHAL